MPRHTSSLYLFRLSPSLLVLCAFVLLAPEKEGEDGFHSQFRFLMMSSIQGRKCATLVYNPGRPGRAQPITMPNHERR